MMSKQWRTRLWKSGVSVSAATVCLALCTCKEPSAISNQNASGVAAEARAVLASPPRVGATTRPTIVAENGVELPVPTAEQAAWQDAELGMFIHFDIEVFDKAYQTSNVDRTKRKPSRNHCTTAPPTKTLPSNANSRFLPI